MVAAHKVFAAITCMRRRNPFATMYCFDVAVSVVSPFKRGVAQRALRVNFVSKAEVVVERPLTHERRCVAPFVWAQEAHSMALRALRQLRLRLEDLAALPASKSILASLMVHEVL